MTADSRHEAMWNWLYACPDLSALFFAFSNNETGNTVLVPMAKEKIAKSYLNGDSIRHYDFTLVQYTKANQDTPNNTENVHIMVDVESIMDWVETQNKERNFPDFPAGCTVQKVETLQSMPTIAGQDEIGAKYMFACRVIYLKKGA